MVTMEIDLHNETRESGRKKLTAKLNSLPKGTQSLRLRLLWPPSPAKAIKLSFSPSPKTPVSTFLFGNGGQRPSCSHRTSYSLVRLEKVTECQSTGMVDT